MNGSLMPSHKFMQGGTARHKKAAKVGPMERGLGKLGDNSIHTAGNRDRPNSARTVRPTRTWSAMGTKQRPNKEHQTQPQQKTNGSASSRQLNRTTTQSQSDRLNIMFELQEKRNTTVDNDTEKAQMRPTSHLCQAPGTLTQHDCRLEVSKR